jgi:uncharacterized protein involved in outer membrane biogenesis
VLANRWFRITLALILLLTALLAASPQAIKYYTSQWLMENGGEQVSFEDVDFNPFLALVLLKGLQVRVDKQTTLSFESVGADLAWAPLFHKQIKLESVILNGFSMLINNGDDGLTLGGIRLPGDESAAQTTDTAPSEWLAGVDSIELHDIQLGYRDTRLDLALVISDLTLSQLAQWNSESAAHVDATGTLNAAPFTINGELAPLASRPSYRLKLKLDKLPLAAFGQLAQPAVSRLSGFVSYDGNADYGQDGDAFTVSHDGSIQLHKLDTVLPDPELHILDEAANFTGKLQLLGKPQQALQIELQADVTLTKLILLADQQSLELFKTDALSLQGLAMHKDGSVAVETVTANHLGIAQNADTSEDNGFLSVKQVDISQVEWSPDRLAIASIRYEDALSNVVRDADGELHIVSILKSMQGAAETPPASDSEPSADEATPGTAAMEISLGRFELAGKTNQIRFQDQAVKPAFQTTIDFKTVSFASLDTGKPEQASPFNIEGTIGKHTSFAFSGDMHPFLTPLGVDLKASITALDMPPLSPYTRDSLGLVFASGSLDSDISFTLNKVKMEGNIDLVLNQMELETVESANSLQNKIPVPINIALDTLRDSNNTIDLNIPFEGDPNNPSFDVNDAISKVLAKSLKAGAMTYLSLALQPYGAVITAAKYAGEAINRVQLKAVEYSAGDTVINAEDKTYLAKIAAMLKERPKLAIKVCGVATGADRLFMQQAAKQKTGEPNKPATDSKPAAELPAIDDSVLLQLAGSRGDGVKDYLVENFGTPASQLVSCQPRLDTESAEAKARTDLLI